MKNNLRDFLCVFLVCCVVITSLSFVSISGEAMTSVLEEYNVVIEEERAVFYEKTGNIPVVGSFAVVSDWGVDVRSWTDSTMRQCVSTNSMNFGILRAIDGYEWVYLPVRKCFQFRKQ